MSYEEGSQKGPSIIYSSKDTKMIMEPRMTKISIRTEIDEMVKQHIRRAMESELPTETLARYITSVAQSQINFNSSLDKLFLALERPPIEQPSEDDKGNK